MSVILALAMLKDSPSFVTMSTDFRDLLLAVLDGCGTITGLLSMAETGPDSPGKQTIAKNQ